MAEAVKVEQTDSVSHEAYLLWLLPRAGGQEHRAPTIEELRAKASLS